MLLILAATVTIYLTALTFMMVLRVLYPFFSAAEDSKAYSFLYATTEPFLMPGRQQKRCGGEKPEAAVGRGKTKISLSACQPQQITDK